MTSAPQGISALPSSGKTARDENFPVASLLLPARIRGHVKTFYRFARAADDIADSPALTPEEKLTALAALGSVLINGDGTGPVRAMRNSLAETRVTAQHCRDLLRAFSQDATKDRYASWEELMDYCILSAAPVGRYVIDLHGGPGAAYFASDALCCALQVLNHVQDCRKDYVALDRVYLPQDWMQAEGAHCDTLSRKHAAPALRRVLDRCLAGIEALLMQAQPLPAMVASTRLAMESSAILAIARSLTRKLQRRDPIAQHVTLSRWQYLSCIASGTARTWWQRLLPPHS